MEGQEQEDPSKRIEEQTQPIITGNHHSQFNRVANVTQGASNSSIQLADASMMRSGVEADMSVTAHPELSREVYTQMLKKLSDGLVGEDMKKMKFLCHDLVKKKSFFDEENLDAFKLFEEMHRNGSISPKDVRVLSQIMCLIGKKYLQREALTYVRVPAWNLGMKSLLPNLRYFFYRLYQQILPKDLERMKQYCLLEGTLTNAESAGINDALDLFNALTDREHVTPDNIEFLSSLVKIVNSDKLNAIVTAYKENYLTSGDSKPDESNTIPPESTVTADGTLITSAPMQETGSAARGTELSTLSMIQQPVERPERRGSYPMRTNSKGICLLLMYDEFDTARLNPRTGHRVDQEKLEEIFGEILNFKVILKHNKSFQETQDIIENMQKTEEHGDCFVCFVCSHGNGESFFTKDGEAFHFQDLYDYFTPNKCPALLEKPKVFFMNLCLRESTKLQRFVVCGDGVSSDGPETEGLGTKRKELHPEHANFFISYSTVPGYSSARHKTDGTFYVQNLYKVFKENHRDFHLSELLVKVRKSINDQFLERPEPGICQVPTDLNTLTRSLYFQSELPRSHDQNSPARKQPATDTLGDALQRHRYQVNDDLSLNLNNSQDVTPVAQADQVSPLEKRQITVGHYKVILDVDPSSLSFHVAVTSPGDLEQLHHAMAGREFKKGLEESLMERMWIVMTDGLYPFLSFDEQSVLGALQYFNTDEVSDSIQDNRLFCDYCKVVLEEEWQHDYHIESKEHSDRIASRQSDRHWTCREPPKQITNGKFDLCQKQRVGLCSSDGDPVDCQLAHSEDELREWNERHVGRLNDIRAMDDQSAVSDEQQPSSRSRWDELIRVYEEKHKSANTEKIGELTFLENEDYLIDSESHIYLGKYQGQWVAVKMVPKHEVQQEEELFNKMKDKKMSNILKIAHIEKDKRIFFVASRLCEYDLSHIFEPQEAEPVPGAKERLTLERRVKLCVEILTGLHSLHSLDIIHRDLKPRNVLIDENGEAVLADFGISRNMSGKTTRQTKAYGTDFWMASEIICEADLVRYKKSSDIQVTGYLIYYILSNGHHPYEATSPFKSDHVGFCNNLKAGTVKLDHIGDVPGQCKDLLRMMLSTDQADRPRIEECLRMMKDVHQICIKDAKKEPVRNSDISLSLSDFGVDCYNPQYSVSVPENRKINWSFRVNGQEKQLQRVYLWHDQGTSGQFSLVQRGGPQSQHISRSQLKEDPDGSVQFQVRFRSSDHGLFHQMIVFDFGEQRVLCRPLLVWIGQEFEKNVPQLGNTLRPSEEYCKIIPFPQPTPSDKFCNDLELQYATDELACVKDVTDLTPDNYKDFFHNMVIAEEKECHQKLKKFDGRHKMTVRRSTSGSKVNVRSDGCQHFGKIHRTESLDDSGASQVVLKLVHTVLLQVENEDVAFEAVIVDDENFDLRERNSFYVTLSEECVKEEKLGAGATVEVNLQLRLDRTAFCKQHFAIDNLRYSQLLFPPKNMFPRFDNLAATSLADSQGDTTEAYQLNDQQVSAKNFITRAQSIIPFRQGPTLIIGPSGTGKTFTLAETIKAIVASDAETKLLVCTKSESAAEPILSHLEALIRENMVVQVLPQESDINSDPDKRSKRKNYCIFKQGSYTYAKPYLEDISDKRVVISTFSTSVYIVELLPEIRGMFTHIIIDEAGQALETETMMPLVLAGPRTVVVLAGDHKQLRPEVFSATARQCRYHRSMLERLFYWSKENHCNNTLFLTDNYRMCQGILDFISSTCYDSQYQFRAVRDTKSDLIPDNAPAMIFAAIVGQEEAVGISYRNELEAKEILRQIKILKSWPRFDDIQITVLSPYMQQVEYIRSLLTKFVNVTVSSVKNVQGSQADVVFISPVRTRKLMEEAMPVPEDKYLGMLSDEGELITSFTRAKSVLLAVGDPNALCCEGDCRHIWKAYIKRCRDFGRLENAQEDLTSLLQEEIGMMSPVERNRHSSKGLQAEQSLDAGSEEESDMESEFGHYDDDLNDEILEGIEQAVRERCETDSGEKEHNVEVEKDMSQVIPQGKRKRKLKYRLLEGEELRWLSIRVNSDRSRLQSGYQEETEEEAEDDMSMEEQKTQFLAEAKLNPSKHPVCLIRVLENNMAVGIPSTGAANRVIFKGKRNIERALDGDQVGAVVTRQGENVSYGKVLCILRRAEDLKWKKLVCTLDEEDVGLMRPLEYSKLHYYPNLYIFPNGVKKMDREIEFGLYSINPKQERKIQLEKNIKVKYSEMSEKLYIVQYSGWYPDVAYPMGIVTKEISPCENLRDGLIVLRLRHGVKDKFPARLSSNESSSEWAVDPGGKVQRADFRDRAAFTIGKLDHRDLDCALHVEQLEDEMVELGIHLSDVASFVPKDSAEDQEAFKRATSFYDGCLSPSHMLPTQLSRDGCCFKPNEERLSVSIVLTCDKNTDIKSSKVIRSQVCCACNLTFGEVEDFFLNNYGEKSEVLQNNPAVKAQLEILSRLLSDFPVPIPVLKIREEDYVNFPIAYMLLHKVNVLGNALVAKLLRNAPGGSIVLRQLPPQDDNKDAWCEAHQRNLTKLLFPPSLKLPRMTKLVDNKPVAIMKSTFGEIQQSLQSGKDKVIELSKILQGLDGFPEQAVATSQLNQILPKEEYISTEWQEVKSHFALQEDRVYTYMAPSRSYLDLVVQRMLIAHAIDGSRDPYASADVLQHIAHHCTRQLDSAMIYEESAKRLGLALKLRKIPHHLPAMVQSASEEQLSFSYPFNDFLKAGHITAHVPLSYLKPGNRPAVGGKSIDLKWRNRIYSVCPEHTEEVSDNVPCLLSTDDLVCWADCKTWEKLLKITRDQYHDELEELTVSWKDTCGHQDGTVKEVTCEKVVTAEGLSEIKKYVEFSREFKPGHVVELQLCSQLNHGIPEPKIQLFKLTPKYDICLEHRAKPVECFTEIANRLPACFNSIDDYISAWTPVIKMLTAYSAIMEDETILIRDVTINWSRTEDSFPVVHGRFDLEETWCDDRLIMFSRLPERKSRAGKVCKQQDPSEEKPALTSDYVCVRVHNHKSSESDKTSLEKFELKQRGSYPKTDIILPEESTLVVHGVAGQIGQPKGAQHHQIQFEVSQKSCDLPDELFVGEGVTCTVEMIPKPESLRWMETALAYAENCGELIKNIILQEPCSVSGELEKFIEEGQRLVTLKKEWPTKFTPNESQEDAICKALTKPFTVIQGPPGTGKTKTGALITTLFHKVNRRVSGAKGPRKQILYCGPSNKSVDVIAKDLMFIIPNGLKFVRVYSDLIEQRDYPIRGVESAEMKFPHGTKEDTEKVIQKYALHQLIQTEAGKKGKEMKTFYKKLERGLLKPTLHNIRTYKRLVWEAKVIVLEQKDVILCTCNTAGTLLLKKNLTVAQCIIDEAGMCMELETLIPFVSQKPIQVVLIGDHKQLRPIIQERRVRQLGAEKSLMEKYDDTAFALNIQYRMHEDICSFPSKQFYDDMLKTDKHVKRRAMLLRPEVWPGTSHCPRVFCHIEGVEDSLTVRTAEGNEYSKSNDIEAREAVRIAKYLTGKLRVKCENLVILSQYRLQCQKIRDRLNNPDIAVQTITKSQGSEWDFVILSTVRSLPEEEIPEIPGRGWRRFHLGFIEDPNQMNVGLTRAKQGLIIVGNKNLLETCKTWKKLIESYSETRSVVDAESFWRR